MAASTRCCSSLILSVVPDGAAAFREAWRVLRPGGRAVIFDKFLPEAGRLSLLRRAIGAVLRVLGTDPNRRLSQLIAGAPGLVVERNEPSLLRGQYRIVLLRKELVIHGGVSDEEETNPA